MTPIEGVRRPAEGPSGRGDGGVAGLDPKVAAGAPTVARAAVRDGSPKCSLWSGSDTGWIGAAATKRCDLNPLGQIFSNPRRRRNRLNPPENRPFFRVTRSLPLKATTMTGKYFKLQRTPCRCMTTFDIAPLPRRTEGPARA